MLGSDLICVPEVYAVRFSHQTTSRLDEIWVFDRLCPDSNWVGREFYLLFGKTRMCRPHCLADDVCNLLAVRYLISPLLLTKIASGRSNECSSRVLRKTRRNAYLTGHTSGLTRSAIMFRPWPFCQILLSSSKLAWNKLKRDLSWYVIVCDVPFSQKIRSRR